jgi:pimeloyl-ACP methyl ester carboxylesterase
MKQSALLFCLVAAYSFAGAQEPPGERVLFRSADDVELIGRFYRSPKKKPTVLLLHGVGDKHSSRVWRPLAERLHKAGYAVLSFDFRGHGQSTTVDPDSFWVQAANRTGIRGAKDEEIEVADFTDRYWPVLINDIAAAKAYLDRQNDAGECNSANLVIVGANEGATLGAAWLYAECFRHRQHPPPFLGAPPQTQASPEAQHVLCALWLNIGHTLGSRTVSLASILDTPVRRYRIPMVVFYDHDSAVPKRTAEALGRTVKQPRVAYAGLVGIGAGGAERGEDLLVRHYSHEQVLEYLRNVAGDEGDEWQDFDSRKAQFIWRTPRAIVPANRLGSNTLMFQTYESFLAP